MAEEASGAEVCPKWDTLVFENGEESYGNMVMAVKESSPSGISGKAVMPLGLTGRMITVKGIMEGGGLTGLKTKQELYEAACETLGIKKYTTGNGRTFDSVRFISIVWGRIFGNAVTGGSDAEYTAILEQIVPNVPLG